MYSLFGFHFLKSRPFNWPEQPRELIPPITAFLEEDLKLVHTGGNLTPGDGVGSRRERLPLGARSTGQFLADLGAYLANRYLALCESPNFYCIKLITCDCWTPDRL